MIDPMLTKEASDFARVALPSVQANLVVNVDAEALLRKELAHAWETGRRFGRREAVQKIKEAMELT